MKKLIILALIIVSCKPEPQFYIDGKPYIIRKGECIKKELTVNFHGPLLTNECVEWIQLKLVQTDGRSSRYMPNM